MGIFINLNYDAPKIIIKSSSSSNSFAVCFRRLEVGDLRCGHSFVGLIKMQISVSVVWERNRIEWTDSEHKKRLCVGRSIKENGNGRALV